MRPPWTCIYKTNCKVIPGDFTHMCLHMTLCVVKARYIKSGLISIHVSIVVFHYADIVSRYTSLCIFSILMLKLWLKWVICNGQLLSENLIICVKFCFCMNIRMPSVISRFPVFQTLWHHVTWSSVKDWKEHIFGEYAD